MTQKPIKPGKYCYYKIVLEEANCNVSYCFSSMNQLKKFIKCEFDRWRDTLIYNATFCRMIANIEQVNWQILHTLDEDLFSCLPDNYEAKTHNEDSCTIYVVEKLLYPRDMGKKFEEMGISYFKEKDYSSDVPLISEAPNMAVRTSRGPNDFSGNDKRPTPSCRSATPTDIIVDMNLHELYPKKTGKVPQSLERIFKSGERLLVPQEFFKNTR